MARKAVSLRCPFGRQARKVDPVPLFQAPLFRLDGILGRVLAQILCTRLIDAEPLMRGSEEKAKKNGDYAFLLHLSRHSKAPAAIIMPRGVLFRGSE
jgi:hypothetical protein